jgi:hypothetical protein
MDERKMMPYKNGAENLFHETMVKEGWEVTRRGSPDFFCWRNERFICVEIKPKRGRRLKHAQRRVLASLVKRGIECYAWSPEDGFQKITLPIGKI